MKIAMIIAGRIFRYEQCLIPFLKLNKDYIIHLYISINSELDLKVIEDLKPWLKGYSFEKYELPKDFNYTNDFKYANRIIDGKIVPYNQMSMYYNELKAFNMAIKSGIEYSIYMKYRSDIINEIPFNFDSFEKGILYTMPYMIFGSYGIYKKDTVGDAYNWGSIDVMKVYFNTYNYVLKKMKETNYLIHFESCITDNCYENGLKIEYLERTYTLDRFRSLLDPYFKVGGHYLSEEEYLENKNKKYIKIVKQE